MKYRCFFCLVLSLTIFGCGSVVSEGREKNVIDIPGYGMMSDNSKINRLLTDDQQYTSSTVFKYVYLSDIIDDKCLNSKGRIIDSILYKKMRLCMDGIMDFSQNKRYVLRVFPSCNASGPINGAKLLSNVNTDDGNLYIWYPSKLYHLTKGSAYPPKVVKWTKSVNFKKTNNLSVVDFRNPLFFDMYEKLLFAFSKYLQEEVFVPNLKSSTIQVKKCRKGDFISRIEMGFLGLWGEGCTLYNGDNTSKDLIKVVELYKKYLSDYWLIAPSFGMSTMATQKQSLYEFEHYLMTTTYGSKNKNSEGMYKGDKEFGLFIDHLGLSDCDKDFNILNHKGKNELRSLAEMKYKKAPVIGENGGKISRESKRIGKDIKKFGISMIKVWGGVSDVNDSVIVRWSNALCDLGFSMKCKFDGIKVVGSKLSITGYFQNVGYTPCYDDCWLPQFVIRSKNDNNLYLEWDVPFDLRTMDKNAKKIDNLIDISSMPKGEYEICFRVVDKFHICENLKIDDYEESAYREYKIDVFNK